MIHLSDEERSYERSAFTFMMLLGELGGVFGIIVAIPSFFISKMVERIFISHLAQLMPEKPRGDSQANQQRSSLLKEKLKHAPPGSDTPVTLDGHDAESLAHEA